MKNAAPPSIGQCSKTSLFLIGKNSRGNWVVQDQQGLRGGLFIGRAEALRYAMFENGNRPQAAIMVPEFLSSIRAVIRWRRIRYRLTVTRSASCRWPSWF